MPPIDPELDSPPSYVYIHTMTQKPTAAQLREMSGCLCFSLRRAARAISHVYDAALRPYGLRGSQLPVLVAASMREAVLMAPLAEALGMDRTTLLRNLRPLVRKKLLEVGPAAHSRRTEIRATAAGRALVARVHGPWRRAQAQARRSLKDPEWARRLQALVDVVQSGHR